MAKQFLVRPDTRAWVFQVRSAFVVAVLLCGVGLWNLPHDSADRAFLVVSCIFCVYGALTLAKTVRDNHEAEVLSALPEQVPEPTS